MLDTILTSRLTWLVARIMLTSAFWTSGLLKLIDFGGAVAEVATLGLPLPYLTTALTIIVQIVSSVLVITGRLLWLGAGGLAIFTLAATVAAHAFWLSPAGSRLQEFATFMEHFGLIAGFLLAMMFAQGLKVQEL